MKGKSQEHLLVSESSPDKEMSPESESTKKEMTWYSGSDGDSDSTLGAVWPSEGPAQRNCDM